MLQTWGQTCLIGMPSHRVVLLLRLIVLGESPLGSRQYRAQPLSRTHAIEDWAAERDLHKATFGRNTEPNNREPKKERRGGQR